MPWNVTDTVDERMRFVVAAQSGTLSMTVVCAGFGISRETGYKWLARYTDGGFAALLRLGRRVPAHHIDNLEAASPSDNVDIEVNGDSYSFFAYDLAG